IFLPLDASLLLILTRLLRSSHDFKHALGYVHVDTPGCNLSGAKGVTIILNDRLASRDERVLGPRRRLRLLKIPWNSSWVR
ncbi:MAG: hypothetical protein M3Y68_11100, partial [Chloroflexota bacterium]|nr:hypothetical protein [Chloroflexota bacterium]